MHYLRQPFRLSEIIPGEYDFQIVASNVIVNLQQVQVAYRLSKLDDKSFRVYHLEQYTIDLTEGSDFRNLMDAVFYSIYQDFIVDVDTNGIVDAGGFCNIILDENGNAKIDIKSMQFDVTMCGEVDLSDEDRDIYCN